MTPLHLERLFSVLSVVAAFTASGCLFLIELFAGKQLLPQFGGAPGVWITCLAFFQVALVAAYCHADRLIRRWSPRSQVGLQAMLFATAAIVEPLGPGDRGQRGRGGSCLWPLRCGQCREFRGPDRLSARHRAGLGPRQPGRTGGPSLCRGGPAHGRLRLVRGVAVA
jgi:hypothetical protein